MTLRRAYAFTRDAAVLRERIIIAFVVSLLPLVATSAHACSAVACIDSGIEVQRNFVVAVRHDGKPITGVNVQISGNTGNSSDLQFAGVTGPDGTVRVSLPAGEYWLTAKLLGITAAHHCFHVAKRASRKAKRKLTYAWGDWAPATRRIAGRLIDLQSGTGENPLLNLVQRVNVPIREARLRLQNPVTGTLSETTSDPDGLFVFDSIPEGTYVLHVEGGKSGRDYDGTDVLIKLRPTATSSSLVLTRRDAGAGDCGGTSLQLVSSMIE